RLLLRIEEERAADRIRASRDRAERRGVEAEVLGRARDLGLDRGDRLADVARLELGELLAVRDDRIGERVQQARALRPGRLPPRTVDRSACGVDRAVDLSLAGHGGARKGLARGGLGDVAELGALD